MSMIKKMLTFLLGKQLSNKNSENIKDRIAYITVFINKKDEMELRCFWDSNVQNNKMSKIYAEMIYNLTTGGYNETIFEAFQNGINIGIVDKEFVLDICKEWGNLKKEYKITPLVKPIDVFGTDV